MSKFTKKNLCVGVFEHAYTSFFTHLTTIFLKPKHCTGSIYLKWTSAVILTMQVSRQCLLSDKMRVFYDPNVSTLRCQINK